MFNKEKIKALRYVTLINKRYEKLWEMQQKILGFLDVDLKTTEAKTELVSRKKK